MEARPFDLKQNDHVKMASWYEKRSMPAMPVTHIGEIGFIVDNYCLGFAYQMGKTEMFWVDGFISNPDTPPLERAKAIDLLGDALEEAIKKAGGKVVMSNTQIRSIAQRAEAHGWVAAPGYTFLSKIL